VPNLADSCTSAWAQYTLQLPNRNRVQSSLKSFGVPSVVYYPIPLSKQIGYQSLPCVSNGVLTSERLAEKVLSLPMHPYLKNDAQLSIIEAVKKSLGKCLQVNSRK
jgi:dTDP-4-amino-4,6-dideoxygalactose transaminase